MVQRTITTLIASTALALLAAGCAEQSMSPSGDAQAVSSNAVNDLIGTWRGWFNIIGGEADRQGTLVLEIKDDATYRLTWLRKGATRNDSGVVVATGRRRVVLNDSSGQSTTLTRDGDTLHGLSVYPGGHPIQISVERVDPAQAP